MKIVALIPLRKNSIRIKNKNVLKINNRPLFSFCLNEALKSKLISKVFIATDIENLTIKKNSKISIFKRSKSSATATAPTEKVINEFLQKTDCDYVVLIQATNLFLTAIDLDKAITKIKNKKNKIDSLLSVVESKYLIWRKKNNKIVSHNYSYKQRPRSQDIRDIEYIENGSFFIFKKENFFKYKNRLHGNIGVHVMNKKSIFEIDDPEDIEIAKKMISM